MNKKLKTYLISAVIFLSGCAGVQTPVPETIQNQDDFVRQVKASNPKIQTLKAKVRVEVKTKDKNYSFKGALMMNKDGYLFMETYGFGIPQGYVSLFDDRLTFVIPAEKIMYVGTSSSQLTRLLRVNTSFSELFDPLMKKILIEDENKKPKVQTTSSGYIITDVEKTKFFVDTSKWINKIERNIGFLVEYGPRWSNKLDYPKNVRLSYEYQSIHISYENMVINEPIPNENFELKMNTDGFEIKTIE